MTMTAGKADVVVGESIWACHPFVGSKAHFWLVQSQHETVYGIKSACGKETVATSQVPLLNPGDWPLCKNCEKHTKERPANAN